MTADEKRRERRFLALKDKASNGIQSLSWLETAELLELFRWCEATHRLEYEREALQSTWTRQQRNAV